MRKKKDNHYRLCGCLPCVNRKDRSQCNNNYSINTLIACLHNNVDADATNNLHNLSTTAFEINETWQASCFKTKTLNDRHPSHQVSSLALPITLGKKGIQNMAFEEDERSNQANAEESVCSFSQLQTHAVIENDASREFHGKDIHNSSSTSDNGMSDNCDNTPQSNKIGTLDNVNEQSKSSKDCTQMEDKVESNECEGQHDVDHRNMEMSTNVSGHKDYDNDQDMYAQIESYAMKMAQAVMGSVEAERLKNEYTRGKTQSTTETQPIHSIFPAGDEYSFTGSPGKNVLSSKEKDAFRDFAKSIHSNRTCRKSVPRFPHLNIRSKIGHRKKHKCSNGNENHNNDNDSQKQTDHKFKIQRTYKRDDGTKYTTSSHTDLCENVRNGYINHHKNVKGSVYLMNQQRKREKRKPHQTVIYHRKPYINPYVSLVSTKHACQDHGMHNGKCVNIQDINENVGQKLAALALSSLQGEPNHISCDTERFDEVNHELLQINSEYCTSCNKSYSDGSSCQDVTVTDNTTLIDSTKDSIDKAVVIDSSEGIQDIGSIETCPGSDESPHHQGHNKTSEISGNWNSLKQQDDQVLQAYDFGACDHHLSTTYISIGCSGSSSDQLCSEEYRHDVPSAVQQSQDNNVPSDLKGCIYHTYGQHNRVIEGDCQISPSRSMVHNEEENGEVFIRDTSIYNSGSVSQVKEMSLGDNAYVQLAPIHTSSCECTGNTECQCLDEWQEDAMQSTEM